MSLIKYSTSIDSENRPSRALKIVARSEIVQTLADVCLNNEYSKSINEQKHVVKLTNGYDADPIAPRGWDFSCSNVLGMFSENFFVKEQLKLWRTPLTVDCAEMANNI